MIFFDDDSGERNDLHMASYPIAALLNHLLSMHYDGKKVRMINFFMRTRGSFERHPEGPPRLYCQCLEGWFSYYDELDFGAYEALNVPEQLSFLWEKACNALSDGSKRIRDAKLESIMPYIYTEGIRRNYVADQKLLESEIVVSGKRVFASIWMIFRGDKLIAELVLENESKVEFLRQEIYETIMGWDQLREIFRKIMVDRDKIVIRGPKDFDSFPIKVPVPKIP